MVRDFPELLPVFREGGIHAGVGADLTLADIGGVDREIFSKVLGALAWRTDPTGLVG